MNLSSTDVNNEFESISVENPQQQFEVFFSGGNTSESDGLIYKDIMIEGEWAYRPGPGQKPTPIPLKVVAGKAANEDEIGMSDLIEAFEAHAIDHVTIPTSHDDKPHENTGYVRKLSIVEGENGKKVLRAGLEFTEPDIRDKTSRGSIANTSAGIIFDYIKKDTGKKFRQVLGHVALTNKPWLNGMKPFGVNASDDTEITPLILADIIWNNFESFTWVKDQVGKALNQDSDNEDFVVADIANGKALISKFDNSSGTKENYVVPFDLEDDKIKISNPDNWMKASKEWVETSLAQENFKDLQNFDNEESLSEEAPNKAAVRDSTNVGGNTKMESTKEEKEETVGAPSDDSAQTVLSEEAHKKAIEELEQKFSEQREADSLENKELRSKIRQMEVKERIEELKKVGLAEYAGLLGEIRSIMLADDGKPALLLSEGEADSKKEVSLTATDIVERIVKALPKTDDGRIVFGDQALAVDSSEAPPQTPENKPSEEESTKALAEGLGIKLPKDGDA